MSAAEGAKGSGGLGLGALLRQRRQALGQPLAEIARDSRIRLAYLEAIEEGRYDDLPGSAYAPGFVRSYAEHLGLDGDEVVRRFRAERGAPKEASKLRFPSPMNEASAPRGAVLLIGALIVLLAYGIYYLTSPRMLDVAEVVLPVPESLRQLIPDRSSGEPPPAKPVAVAPSAAGAPPAKAPAPVPTPPAATPMAQAPNPAPPPPASPVVAAPPPAASIPAAPAGAPAPPSDSAGNRVILRATSDAWVEVRDRPGRTVLISRILKAGETFPVPDRPGLTLLTGNAGGIEVIIDGQALAPLGKAGSVKRNVALDAEQLRGTLNAAN